ncbi:hypothetical protein KSK55_00995 [Methanospirillum purgamenti]|uniref:Uncharacterized protein n=1 Tax=Methanospirillum hungatei TaxID=2203 RepID=A0A8F5VL37_METHU|nr:hypothetical protein [Methanospirillum hungatei]QXO95026.1 hypothetical protein KSK55_00995 [Methanospirillum hungatei]
MISTLILIGTPIYADEGNVTNITNYSANNETLLTSGIKYPSDGLEATEGLDLGVSVQGYADAGRISTGFSGSSIEARGDNQTPSVVMTFSDKSSVSGLIKNFMKSFHYESGIDL